jgi:hypothetical protein
MVGSSLAGGNAFILSSDDFGLLDVADLPVCFLLHSLF